MLFLPPTPASALKVSRTPEVKRVRRDSGLAGATVCILQFVFGFRRLELHLTIVSDPPTGSASFPSGCSSEPSTSVL